MRIDVKSVKNPTRYKDIKPGEMFLWSDRLFLKPDFGMGNPSLALVTGKYLEIPWDELVQRVVSISVEVE